MDWKRVTDRAKQVINQRGGTESLKEDADELRDIAQGPGTLAEKAKQAAEALREPGAHREPGAGSEARAGGEREVADESPVSSEPSYEDAPREADPPTDYSEGEE